MSKSDLTQEIEQLTKKHPNVILTILNDPTIVDQTIIDILSVLRKHDYISQGEHEELCNEYFIDIDIFEPH